MTFNALHDPALAFQESEFAKQLVLEIEAVQDEFYEKIKELTLFGNTALSPDGPTRPIFEYQTEVPPQ